MVDWSTFVLPILFGVVVGVIGAVLEPFLARVGLFHDSGIATVVFFWAGTLLGFALGLAVARRRPSLSPRIKTSIRLVFGAIFLVGGFAQAVYTLLHGVISWGLLEPAAGILAGLYLLIPSSRLSSTKSARILVTAIAGVMSILFLASDYITKQYSDMAIWIAVGCVATLWVLFLQRR